MKTVTTNLSPNEVNDAFMKPHSSVDSLNISIVGSKDCGLTMVSSLWADYQARATKHLTV